MKKISIYGLILLFSFTIIFHLLVITHFISYDVVWGGRITSDRQMYISEFVSVFLNGVFLVVVLIKAQMLHWPVPNKVITVFLWLMLGLFILNTIGNLLSLNGLETLIFTPITILLSFFCFILVRSKSDQKTV